MANWYKLLNAITLTLNNIFHIRLFAICWSEMYKHCMHSQFSYCHDGLQSLLICCVTKEYLYMQITYWCSETYWIQSFRLFIYWEYHRYDEYIIAGIYSIHTHNPFKHLHVIINNAYILLRRQFILNWISCTINV